MTTGDDHLWLEDIDGNEALAWVARENARSCSILESDPRFDEIRRRVFAKLTGDDRLAYGQHVGGYVYNFWQDARYPRGIWRRTTLEDYLGDQRAWETLLGIDALNRAEKANWVFRGAKYCAPSGVRVLLSLSDGGKDAIVMREFDLAAKAFVDGGFGLAQAKQSAAWVDADRLLVASSADPLGASRAGYGIVVRMLERGMVLADAPVLYRGQSDDMAVLVNGSWCDGERFVLLSRRIGFFDTKLGWLRDDGDLIELPVPASAKFAGVCRRQALLRVKDPWTLDGARFEPGSVVALDLDVLEHTGRPQVRPIYAPDAHSSVVSVAASRDGAFIVVSEDVKGRVLKASFTGDAWTTEAVAFSDYGAVTVQSVDGHSDVAMFSFASFLEPETLYLLEGGIVPRAVRTAPEQFDPSDCSVSQRFATSRDGTSIPYFLIAPRGAGGAGQTPVLLFAYGGFERSLTPQYLPPIMQEWIAAGGGYAIANIRGGGEYGPRWHRAALREKRVLAFDDFIAVAEDLIASGLTSPARLGIKGGSNGGLLMGAMLTRRPELFGAVICRVPLLDMLRYHKLQAGASWMAEYGNPDDANDRVYLTQLSPYHNLRPAAGYPPVFFTTSTRDDRVHPGHARKMHARMQALGYNNLYFENGQGGHGTASGADQLALNAAMELVYLYHHLIDRAAGTGDARNGIASPQLSP